MKTKTITCPSESIFHRVLSILRMNGYVESQDQTGRKMFQKGDEIIYVVDHTGKDLI